MGKLITKVSENSIAYEMGVEPGDMLISINGKEVKDVIDYKFLMADENVNVEIRKRNNEVWDLEIEKEYDEKLGIEFENGIMDSAKSCANHCIFCFIDQLPRNMRKTLYFKDDDSRLSFLQGNFVTLTNMSEGDIERIIKYRISPINVSVQTTNPELRIKMLNNKSAGNINERLKRLAFGDIKMNCQIVLCPGINNGKELISTVNDLFKLYPAVQNVAAVPVGITKYRKNTDIIKKYDNYSALKEINLVNKLQEKYCSTIGKPFIRLSDEFYIMAGIDVPDSNFYGKFEQVEDGVGMVRLYRDTIDKSLKNLKTNTHGTFTMVTGELAYDEIANTAKKVMDINNKIKINVVKIINNFFGKTITVAGLITGNDIINQLKDEKIGEYIIIPENMLRSGEKIFLDDISTEQIEEKLHRKILICDYTGEDFIDIINKFSKEER